MVHRSTEDRIRLFADALLVTETYLRTGREEIDEPEINEVCVSKMFNTFRDYMLTLDRNKAQTEINRCGKELFDIIIEVAWNSSNK